jgi:hypothetical protein
MNEDQELIIDDFFEQLEEIKEELKEEIEKEQSKKSAQGENN